GSVCRYARHAREPARWHPGGCHVLHHLGDGERCSLVGSELDEHGCQLWDLCKLQRPGVELVEQYQHLPCCAHPELVQPHRERVHDGLGHCTPAALPSTLSTRASSASRRARSGSIPSSSVSTAPSRTPMPRSLAAASAAIAGVLVSGDAHETSTSRRAAGSGSSPRAPASSSHATVCHSDDTRRCSARARAVS